MAADGSQTFALGYWPSFPNKAYDNDEYGVYVNPNSYTVGISFKHDNLEMYDGQTDIQSNNSFLSGVQLSKISVQGNQGRTVILSSKANGNYNAFSIDSVGVKVFSGTTEYRLLPDVNTQNPSATSGAISSLSWTAGTPSFLRSQHGVAAGTTDGSGDLTVTFAAAMPDATYTMIATVEGTTSYTISVHTKATGTCKVRFFNPATGAAVTATSVTISYEAKDY
jgi:hypothetical protein